MSGAVRVLMVTPYIAPVYGGPARSVTETCAALARAGVRVDLVATNANGGQALPVSADWTERLGYRYRLFSRWPRRGPFVSGELVRWLGSEAGGYDVVHVQTVFNHAAHAGMAAARRTGVPWMVTPRGMFEPWAMRQSGWKKSAYLAAGGRRLVGGASVIQTLVEAEVAGVTTVVPGARTVTVPNGVTSAELEAFGDVGVFFERFPELINRRLIVFLSRVHRQKGLDVLAPAAARVTREFPEAHFVVAGPDDGYLAQAREGFERAGCGSHVSFVGMLEGAVKRAALAVAEVYVLPSHAEGFSMSVLEAMAAGRPCVISEGCNFPEAGAAGAACVVPAEAEAVGGALLGCLRDPGAAREMGERARRLIREHYTWDRVAERLRDLYTGVAGRVGTE
jgi:glycosyltransferase involved in cell wall biosynthesis